MSFIFRYVSERGTGRLLQRVTVGPVANATAPAIAGWFTLDADEPSLLGSRCRDCGTLAFPKATTFCGNPACSGLKIFAVSGAKPEEVNVPTGVDGWFTKPLNPARLVDTLAQAVG